MKFINNTAAATLSRRMAAQGLTISRLCAAITSVSEAAKATVDRTLFGFSEGDLPSKTNVEMAQTISELESYSGGYMYGGEYATVLGGDTYARFEYRTHWSREYDRRDPKSFEEGNLTLLKSLKEGTTLRIGKSAQYSSWEEWILKEKMWVHALSYCEQEAHWAEQNIDRNVYLFSGIRAAVAEKLEVEADYGFHQAFDEAIHLLDE